MKLSTYSETSFFTQGYAKIVGSLRCKSIEKVNSDVLNRWWHDYMARLHTFSLSMISINSFSLSTLQFCVATYTVFSSQWKSLMLKEKCKCTSYPINDQWPIWLYKSLWYKYRYTPRVSLVTNKSLLQVWFYITPPPPRSCGLFVSISSGLVIYAYAHTPKRFKILLLEVRIEHTAQWEELRKTKEPAKGLR